MVVSVACRPAALVGSCLHTAPTVRVLDVAHRILHELVINFYLQTYISQPNNDIDLVRVVLQGGGVPPIVRGLALHSPNEIFVEWTFGMNIYSDYALVSCQEMHI